MNFWQVSMLIKVINVDSKNAQLVGQLKVFYLVIALIFAFFIMETV